MTMLPREIAEWEQRFEALLSTDADHDSSHGLDHVKRVVASAKRLCRAESARPEVVVPAAWLHDCVLVEKSSPERSEASTRAAAAAREFLADLGYPGEYLDEIAHAIEAHSFSAGIEPESPEAKIVQDADRLDALGAIGVARVFTVGGRLDRQIYDPADPFCRQRPADDERATLDHFFVKLLKLPGTMKTGAGRWEAERRVQFLRSFLEQLESELPGGE